MSIVLQVKYLGTSPLILVLFNQKNLTNLFDYFVIGKILIVEDEVGSDFCQSIFYYRQWFP